MVQQSIQGLTHSVSSLTSALGTGLYASGDTDFAKQRSILKGKQNSKPKNMADGIFKGGKKLTIQHGMEYQEFGKIQFKVHKKMVIKTMLVLVKV